MILSLNTLFAKKGEKLKFEKKFYLNDEDLFETLGIIQSDELNLKGSVVSYGETLLLDLDYDVNLHKVCDRCLEEYEEYLEGSFNRTISREENDGISYVEAKDGNVNLHDIVCDEIMMVISSQSLCDDDCKGLCIKCGINLNDKSCDCEKLEIDPRFRALLDFKD